MHRITAIAALLVIAVAGSQASAAERLRVLDATGVTLAGAVVACGDATAQADDAGEVALGECAAPVWVRRGSGEPVAATVRGGVITLPDQPALLLVVHDAVTGKPVAAGTLRWATAGAPEAIAASEWRAADGRLALLATPPASVTIESPGYRAAEVALTRAGAAGQAVLLVPETALALTTTPAAGGSVCYAIQAALGPSVRFRAVATCRPLDPGGATRLEALERGRQYVGVVLPEGAAPALVTFTGGDARASVRLEPGAAVTVQVASEEDVPLSGATVKVTGGVAALERYPWSQESRSGENGAVRLTGALPGAIVVTVAAPGRGTRRIEAEVGEAPALDLGRIVLEPQLELRGAVVDAATKAPVAGANVAAGSASATSGDDGSFVLAGLAAGELSGTVAADGYRELAWTAALPAGAQTFALERAATIVWPLDTGDAVPGSVSSSWKHERPRTRADLGDGRWSETERTVTFSGMGPGTCELEVRVAGFATARTEAEVRTAGETVTLPVTRLESGLGFLGTVVRRDGAPVAGAEVIAEPGSPDVYRPPGDVERAARARSDADGRFTIFGLAQGPYRILVRAPGMARTAVDGQHPEAQGKDLGAITVGEGFAITGRVLRRDRTPLPHTVVEVREGKSYEYTPVAQARSDERGSFAFTAIPAGGSVLRVRLGGREFTAAVAGDDGDEVRQDVTVGGMRVTGQVTVGEQPASGGTLTWSQGEERPRGMVVMFDRGDGDKEIFGVQRPASAEVAADGTFAIEGINPGAYTVRLVVGMASTPTRVVLPDADEHFVPLRFPGGSLAGRVVDEEGEAVRFAQVQAARAGGEALARAVSDEGGGFRLSWLPRERLLLSASAREHEPSEALPVEIGITPEPVLLTLKRSRGGTLTGTLASTHGLVAGAPVALFGPAPALAYARQDGTFEFRALAAGRYRVCARPLGGACGCGGWVEVSGKDTVATSVAIGEGGFVEIETPPELAAARPQVATLEGQDLSSLLFIGNPWRSAGGVIRFGPLASGTYRVALAGVGAAAPLTVTVAAGETTRVVAP